MADAIEHPEIVKKEVGNPAAQFLAERIFSGQSPDLQMNERIARVKRGLEEQGYSMDGINL